MAKQRSERRVMQRADARLSMRLEAPLETGTRAQIVTESQNISASGVYCHSAHYLAPLSKVALTIVLPGFGARRGRVEMVKCEGVVVRCDQLSGRNPHRYELACAFIDMDDQRRGLLAEFVTWRNLQSLRAATRRGTAPAARRVKARPAARRAKPAAQRKSPARPRRTLH